MKVLKFGGTSVGSSENIQKVTQIVKSKAENTAIVVVVSAIGGITDKLMVASDKATQGNLDYKSDFNEIKKHHIEVMDGLLSGSSLDLSLIHI